MKKQVKFIRWESINAAIAAVLIAVSVVFVVWIDQKTSPGVNDESRAVSDLLASNKGHNEYLSELIRQKYSILRSLAKYFGSQDDFDFRNELELVNAVMLEEHYNFIGYADLDGNVIGYEGTHCGNVADSAWFQQAARWKGYDSIEFVASDLDLATPYIHMASPVRKANDLVGILYVSIGADDFADKLSSGNYSGNEIVFVTDTQGNIIFSNRKIGDYICRANLFTLLSDEDLLTSEALTQIKKDLESGDIGQAQIDRVEMEYITYSPLGIGGWMIFSVIPSNVANAQFNANMAYANKTTRLLSLAFLGSVMFACALLAICAHKNRTMLRKLRLQEEAYRRVLVSVDSALYDYDVTTRELSVSEGFAEIFGYSLPKDFFARIPELRRLHPEFDYNFLQQKAIGVEMNRRQDEINLVLRSEIRGLCQIHITLVPRINSDNRVVGIHGMVTDITDSYTDNLNLKRDYNSALHIISALAPMALSANLTQNTYHVISYNRPDLRCVLDELDEGSYDDFISRCMEHIYEEDKEGVFSAFSRESLLNTFHSGQHVADCQYRIINDDGELRWFKGHCVMVQSEIDDSVHLVLVLMNNTAQMEQQEKLQRKYDLTIENMPAYTVKWVFKDGDMLLIDANQLYFDFMKGTAQELIGKSLLHGLDEKEKGALLSRLYALSREKKSISLVHRVVTCQGQGKILDIQASYFEDLEDSPVYFGVLTDVTELITTMERLKRIEEEHQETVDNFVHTILQYNIEERAMRLISGGDSRIDFDGEIRNCPEGLFQSGILESSNFDKVQQFFENLNKKTNSGPVPVALCCKDGTKLFVEATGTMIHNPMGPPTFAMIILAKTGEVIGGSVFCPQKADANSGKKRVFIKTFGPFDVFLDDKPLIFTNAKAKELLALLVARRGGTLSSAEAIGTLWEDEPAGETQFARYRRMASRLKETLEAAGCGDILITRKGIRSIDVSKVSCDYYQLLDGDEAARGYYRGDYMSGYSWAESENAALNRKLGIDNSEI